MRTRLSVAQRRSEILESATTLFSARAYNEVATSDIAAHCGISQGLVFHYFGSKAELYAAVIEAQFERLRAQIDNAVAELPADLAKREVLKVVLSVYLDHIGGRPVAWVAETRGNDIPAEALYVRIARRDESISALRDLLSTHNDRLEYAIPGFFGFVDAACLEWADAGAPADKRYLLIDSALGALEGALGDWG